MHLHRIEQSASPWVRKSNPDLSQAEQDARARALADNLPRLREPKPGTINALTMRDRDRIAIFMRKLQAVPPTERRRISGLVANEKRELFSVYALCATSATH